MSELFLSLCIFVAYMLLMKIFLAYQRQVNEAAAKLEANKAKQKEKEEKLTAKKQKMAQSELNGETGVTPSHHEFDEPLIPNTEENGAKLLAP